LPNSDSQMVYQIPNGPKIAIKSDEDLKKAIAESARARAKFVEIDIGGKAPVSASQSSQPTSAARPAQQSQPASGKSQQSQAPAPSVSGNSISFTLPGTGSGDKVKIAPQPEATCYIFNPTPSAHSTLIEVVIPSARQLQFTMTSSVSKLTQTFNLPFDIALKDLVIQGTTVILNFPF
jgi:hypothetical protein